MTILDTNVLSALTRSSPDAAVVGWLDRQAAESVWITSITVFEARLGLNVLPPGKRRRALEAALARVLEDDLEPRARFRHCSGGGGRIDRGRTTTWRAAGRYA